MESEKQDGISAYPVINSVEKKVESKKQVSTMHENKHINDWTPVDVISWCYVHNLPTFSQLLEDYDGASLLRLHNMSKTSADNDTFHLLQDDCQRIPGNGPVKLTLSEFIRFETELDKRLERDTIRNEAMPIKQSKSTSVCSLL
jgi:hypothetical protein